MPPPRSAILRFEVLGAILIGVASGVYIFQPAAKEAGAALTGRSSSAEQRADKPPPPTASR